VVLEAGTAARELGGGVAGTSLGSGGGFDTLLAHFGSVRVGGDAGPRMPPEQDVAAYAAALSDTVYKQSVLASIGTGQVEQDPAWLDLVLRAGRTIKQAQRSQCRWKASRSTKRGVQ
jgi:hypothetical protein